MKESSIQPAIVECLKQGPMYATEMASIIGCTQSGVQRAAQHLLAECVIAKTAGPRVRGAQPILYSLTTASPNVSINRRAMLTRTPLEQVWSCT